MSESVTHLGGSGRRPAEHGRAVIACLLRSGVFLLLAALLCRLGIGMVPGAVSGDGTDALARWILVAVLAAAVVVSLRLCLVWALAAGVRLLGTRRRPGHALLGVLRVLAPRLARTVCGSLAATTVVAGLALGPAQAAPVVVPPDGPDRTQDVVDVTTDLPAVPVLAAPPGEAPDDQDLPPLGWGRRVPDQDVPGSDPPPDQDPAPAPPDAEPTATRTAGAGSDRSQAGPADATDTAGTVTVRSGDTLWGLTDQLLEGDDADDAVIAATWPELYAANEDVIGPDPDHIEPGTRLDVPAGMTAPQEER